MTDLHHDDDHGPHLNTAADPCLARRAVDAEIERNRQLDALDEMPGMRPRPARALALARARRRAALAAQEGQAR